MTSLDLCGLRVAYLPAQVLHMRLQEVRKPFRYDRVVVGEQHSSDCHRRTRRVQTDPVEVKIGRCLPYHDDSMLVPKLCTDLT